MTRQLDLFALFDDPKPAPEPPASPAPASEPEEAPLDLREALTTYASAEGVWASMAQHGASDEDIAAATSGRTLHLRDIYRAIEGTAKVREAKAAGHNWRAQVRRSLQYHFRSVGDATWSPA